MRVTLCILMIAVASASDLTGSQVREGPDGRMPTRIRDVAKLKRIISDYGTVAPAWAEFDFKGVRVWGDMWLRDYNDAITIARRYLRRDEKIYFVDGTPEHIPSRRERSDHDLEVQTCPVKRCSGGGRIFLLKRMDGALQLVQISVWQS